ncbi:MAG: VWA domain-containing protein [Atopobiaceae bacterium]|nr:VWA domain-containing protein [Atopobiaceae bacterium]
MKKNRIITLVLLAVLVVDCLCLFLVAGERQAEAADDPGPLLVAIGDSYSSGEGAPPFFGESSSSKYEGDGNYDWLAHRSERAWSGKLKVEGQDLAKDTSWIFKASSGAITDHILGTDHWNDHGKQDSKAGQQLKEWKDGLFGKSGETYLPCQIDAFDGIDRNAIDYVTMTIGGNDLGFGGIIEECFFDIGDVEASGVKAAIDNSIDLYRNSVKDDLLDTYDAVLEKMGSKATLLVVGYPHLSDGMRFMINEGEASELNHAVDVFDTETEALVRQLGRSDIEFVDPRGYFSHHENKYINDINLISENQDLALAPYSAYSMHPNAAGQEAYARAVQARIDVLEYQKAEYQKASEPPYPAADVASNVSMAIVMDVSGSMDSASALSGMSKLESARKQSIDFVSKSVRASGDAASGGMSVKVGVASFSTTSAVDCGLTNNVDDLTAAIENLSTIGRTNIYAGLDEGIKMLENEDGPRVMVFLSDGLSNEGPDGDQILELANDAADKDIKVYTIGFGPSYELDEDLLRSIADITGGTYEHEDSSDIESAAVGLFATMMNAQLSTSSTILSDGTGTVQQDGTAEVGTFEVTQNGTIQAYLYWPGSVLDLVLTDPDGTVVEDGYQGLSLDTSTIPTSLTIQNAKMGVWKMSVFGREVSMTNEPYYAVAAFNEAPEPEVTTPVAGGGGAASDSGMGLMFLLATIAIGCIFGVYALSVRRR